MPHGDELLNALHALEKFVNARHEHIPPLFAVAITHYQFETIHPFSDGNGRIGRVLISRSLVKEGLLEHPVVYMSAYINEHRKQYADLLLRISQQGGQAWSDWIGFFLDAIRTQALDAIWRSEELINVQVRFHELLKEDGAPPRLFAVVDSLFAGPAINIADLMKQTETTKTTAGKDIERLERLGIRLPHSSAPRRLASGRAGTALDPLRCGGQPDRYRLGRRRNEFSLVGDEE
jgi:Fic family protein